MHSYILWRSRILKVAKMIIIIMVLIIETTNVIKYL